MPKRKKVVEEQKEATSEQRRALFETYEAHLKKVANAEALLEEAKIELSVAVQTIVQRCGTGPYIWRGEKLTPGRREDRFFFKREKPPQKV